MPTVMHAAVVGAGYWGANLSRVLQSVEGLQLTTVCDPRPAIQHEIKERYSHLSVTPSLADVLRDAHLDAVFLATPPATHYTLARAALTAGKHVWVEKPLALSYEEGRELTRLAREAHRTLFVDETFLYDPLLQQARTLIASGQLGKIFHVSLERTGMGRIRRDSNVWWNSAPHDLSIVRHLLDAAVTHVSATGHAFLQPGIEDIVWASLRLAGGISAHIYLSWLCPEKKASLMVVGGHGMLGYEGRFEKRALTRYAYRLGQSPGKDSEDVARANLIPIDKSEIVEVIQGDRAEPLQLACAAFRDSILSGQPALSSGEHSLRTLAALEAGSQSLAHAGAWKKCPSS